MGSAGSQLRVGSVIAERRRLAFGLLVPAMLYLGLVAGMLAGVIAGWQRHLTTSTFIQSALLIVVLGFAGARFWHVLKLRRVYKRDWRRAWYVSCGDEVVFGAILFALPVSVPVLLTLGVSPAAFWDAGAIGVAAGMTVARLGCAMTGCGAGRPSAAWLSWRMRDHRGVERRRLPVPQLEFLLTAGIFVVLVLALGYSPLYGRLALLGLSLFGAGRFTLEGMREHISPASRAAAASLALFAISAAVIVPQTSGLHV